MMDNNKNSYSNETFDAINAIGTALFIVAIVMVMGDSMYVYVSTPWTTQHISAGYGFYAMIAGMFTWSATQRTNDDKTPHIAWAVLPSFLVLLAHLIHCVTTHPISAEMPLIDIITAMFAITLLPILIVISLNIIYTLLRAVVTATASVTRLS